MNLCFFGSQFRFEVKVSMRAGEFSGEAWGIRVVVFFLQVLGEYCLYGFSLSRRGLRMERVRVC